MTTAETFIAIYALNAQYWRRVYRLHKIYENPGANGGSDVSM